MRSVKLVASVAAGLRGYDAEHQGADAGRDVLAGVVMLVPAVGVEVVPAAVAAAAVSEVSLRLMFIFGPLPGSSVFAGPLRRWDP